MPKDTGYEPREPAPAAGEQHDNAPEQTSPSFQLGLADEVTGRLAFELVARLEERDTILRKYGLTEDDLIKILGLPLFQAMLRDANLLWHSSAMAPERIKQKALMSVEHLVPRMFAIANDPKINGATRLAAGNYLATLAGLNKKDVGDLPGAGMATERFSLTINMGEQKLTITKDNVGGAPVIEHDPVR